jgi:hypothetical protein
VTIEPVRHTVTVYCDADRAFQTFTAGIAGWWPYGRRSVGGDRVREAVFEGRVGGRVFERWDDGTTVPWADVTTFDPPRHIVLRWYPGQGVSEATDVEIAFEPLRAGVTRVRLEHSGWERLADGAERRDSYEGPTGWGGVLAGYGLDAADPDCHQAFARQANVAAWELLALDDRNAEQEEALRRNAYASAFHWFLAGGPTEATRAEWLLARVGAVLDDVDAARRHAERALALCAAHDIGDFDLAYAYEAMARAATLAGEGDAAAWRAKADSAGAALADPEDRRWFLSDLGAGPWARPTAGPSPPR